MQPHLLPPLSTGKGNFPPDVVCVAAVVGDGGVVVIVGARNRL